jgi:hypothetical protein
MATVALRKQGYQRATITFASGRIGENFIIENIAEGVFYGRYEARPEKDVVVILSCVEEVEFK